ncbi:MAG: YigZ family protein [Christensenellaceae bacterium]|jgi:uncharacterized YigZ family protein|nr:YigZ family protein [Christensenellaceae bacterium]
MRAYRTVRVPGEAEYTLHKSRFIGRCFPLQSEAEALGLLADIRKRHWDATHNCYAYRIGEQAQIARYSDDGEPGGTAGLPMLDVLSARQLTDVLVVVTRYFGGVLLGAGGLVRAYARGAAEAAAAAGEMLVSPGVLLELRLDYARYGGIESYVRANSTIQSANFAEDVCIQTLVAQSAAEGFIHEIIEHTGSRCVPRHVGEGKICTAL